MRVLQKLCSVLLQPWRMHGHMGPTPQRCMILSICISTLRLLRTMLTELLRGGAFQFRDTRVANVLVSLHMIVCSIPASGRLDGEETRVQALIVDVLLTFTQGVNEEVRKRRRGRACLSSQIILCRTRHCWSMCAFGAGDSHRRDFGQQHVVSDAEGGFGLAAESSRRSVLWAHAAVRAPASSTANAEHSGNPLGSPSVSPSSLSPSDVSCCGINTRQPLAK